MSRLRHVAAALALALAAGCATNPPEDLLETVHAARDAEGVQRVDIVAGNYYFMPRRVIVETGAPVLLLVRKEPGVVPHTFVLHAPEAGVAVDIPLNVETETIRFTPSRPGRYTYYCKQEGLFGDHSEKGMVGVLEVRD